jgi:predicted Fe-S protein YdhL (DUF1289 family)
MERMLQGPIPRHSPCVGVCTLDPASGWCLGCGRNTDEIARWSTMDEAQQLDCWSKPPRRLATLAVQAHLLPWAVDHITKWVGTTLAVERGTWVNSEVKSQCAHRSTRFSLARLRRPSKLLRRRFVKDEVPALVYSKVPSRVVPFLNLLYRESQYETRKKKTGVPFPSCSQCIETQARD